MSLVAEKVYSLEEYFELEKKFEIRHEYVYGILIPMPGESKLSNEIAGNCYFILRTLFKNTIHKVYFEDVRLRVNADVYRYPDLAVAPNTDVADTHAVTQPRLLIEVLSPSTEATDRTEKLRQYSNISSLQYYLLISQDKYLIERYTRQDNHWQYDFFDQLSDKFSLDFYGIELNLREIYEGIQFS